LSEPQPLTAQQREKGTQFAPKFDASGLITCVVVDAVSRQVLVLAFMNKEALSLTRSTGTVHFWSRSRNALWMKGETSGNVLKVEEIRVDCDQDALVIAAVPAGPTCHTGETSCFYRVLESKADDAHALVRVKT